MTDRGLKWRTVATPSGGTQSNHAPRIPEAEWETHKPAIVDMYMTNNWPLTQVKEQMQKAPHNFSATTRQYVHQLGKWGIEKYNTKPKGSKKQKPKKGQAGSSQEEPPKPQVPADENVIDLIPTYTHYDAGPIRPAERLPVPNQPYRMEHRPVFMEPIHKQRRLASMLYACGDPSSFAISMRCCNEENLLHDLIACHRAVQTPNQAAQARRELERLLNYQLQNEIQNQDTWLTVLVDLMSARTFDYGSDRSNATGQLEQKVIFIFSNQENPRNAPMRLLTTRGHKMDLPLFLYFWHALKMWNYRCDTLRELDKKVDIDNQLKNFISQQIDGRFSPGSGSTEKITCLLSCLRFCLEALESNTNNDNNNNNNNNNNFPTMIPEQLQGMGEKYQVYQVIAMLWKHWLVAEASYWKMGAMPELSWTKNAPDELAIPSEELLVTVACMVTSEAKYWLRSGVSVMEGARRAASKLSELPQVAIFHRFLHQYQRNNEERLVSLDNGFAGSVATSDFSPFRAYIFDSLDLSFEARDPHLPIFPLVLTSPE